MFKFETSLSSSQAGVMIHRPLIQTATGKCTVHTSLGILGRVRTQHGARWRTSAHALAHGCARVRTVAQNYASPRRGLSDIMAHQMAYVAAQDAKDRKSVV